MACYRASFTFTLSVPTLGLCPASCTVSIVGSLPAVGGGKAIGVPNVRKTDHIYLVTEEFSVDLGSGLR